MARFYRNEFNLDSEIKSKKVQKKNRNLDTKKKKYIVARLFHLITQS